MLKEHKGIIDDFEKKAHPIDIVNYAMQKEMLVILKNILKELKDRNN